MDSKGDERRVCVITGANSGIGFATALGMAQKGWQVVLACRSLPSAQEAVKQIRSQLKQGNSNEEGEKKEQSEEEDQSLVVMKLDLADLNSVDEFASAFQKRFTKLHALILNAGVVTTSKKQSAQGHELMFAVNHLGHFLLTQRLLPVLQASAPSRIVVVSSEAHKFCGPLGQELTGLTNPPEFSMKESMVIYGRSKLCNILFMHEFNKRLNAERSQEQGDEGQSSSTSSSSSSSSSTGGVTVNALHPGAVHTNLGREAPWYLSWLVKPISYLFFRTPESGARTSIYLASSDAVEGVSGKYFSNERESTPKPYALDDEAATRLWKWSEELIDQWQSASSPETADKETQE